MTNLNEETTTGSIAGHSRPVDVVVKRIDIDEEGNKCPTAVPWLKQAVG